MQKSLMLGYMCTDVAEEGRECQVRLLDQLRPSRIIADSPCDPENEALRAYPPLPAKPARGRGPVQFGSRHGVP